MISGGVDFYFDFMSPYAYLAHHRLVALTERYRLTIFYRPIDLQQAKLAVGNTGPANREIPIKHRYLRADLKRWADHYGVPFVPPAGYGSDRLNRGAFYALDRNCAQRYVSEAWNRVWGNGGAMNDDALLCDVAQSMGWDEAHFLAEVETDAFAQRLKESNAQALERGVFGVPTMAIDDQIWWGNDRLHFLESHLIALSAKTKETP